MAFTKSLSMYSNPLYYFISLIDEPYLSMAGASLILIGENLLHVINRVSASESSIEVSHHSHPTFHAGVALLSTKSFGMSTRDVAILMGSLV